MPQQKQPITDRPRVDDRTEGDPEFHGKHSEGDEGLPGAGGTKGGLNRDAGDGSRGSRQNDGRPKGNPPRK